MVRSSVCGVLVGLAVAVLAAPALAADQVSVQLDWVVRGNHAMFFVAKEKGYFAQNGIEVTEIRKGTGSPDAMRLVANGNAEFGFGDLPTLAVARSQNVPVVALARGQPALADRHDRPGQEPPAEDPGRHQGPEHRHPSRRVDLYLLQGVPGRQRHDRGRHEDEQRVAAL